MATVIDVMTTMTNRRSFRRKGVCMDIKYQRVLILSTSFTFIIY